MAGEDIARFFFELKQENSCNLQLFSCFGAVLKIGFY